MADVHSRGNSSVSQPPPTPSRGEESVPLTPPAQTSRARNPHLHTLSKGTPMGSSSHGPEAGYETVEEEAKIVAAELSGSIHLDEDFDKRAFIESVASEEKIQQFLRECDLYDTAGQRWTEIPIEAPQEAALYKPFFNILRAVVDYFKYSGTRTVIDTHNMKMNHVEGNGNPEETKQLKTSPDIVIKGTGSNYSPKPFKPSKHAAGSERVDYLRCTSPLEVKTTANRNFKANLTQIAIYARQCFIQQQNRKAVYSLIMTEKYVVLYMFDRSGVNHSVDVDIHQDAATFVRFILGVASPDDNVVGFDTSIFWEGQNRFLRSVDAEGNNITYRLAKPYPVFYRRAIRSRGTNCWQGVDPTTGQIVLIKDAWRSSLRRSETEFLDEVKNLDLAGVVRMVACQADEENRTSTLRGIDMRTLPSSVTTFRDRTFSRIIFIDGGKPIYNFSTKGEVLYALRDAIAGHQRLWDAGILHRDVSINNILIGHPGANAGQRGVIIDLDLAIWILRRSSCWGFEFRTGTRAFQSINVLRSYDDEKGEFPPHDYLDDLESFFYVFCWVCFGYAGPKSKVQPFSKTLLKWENEDPEQAANSKLVGLYLDDPNPNDLITDYFGPVFRSLFVKLLSFFKGPPYARKHKKIAKDVPWPTLEEMLPGASEHYRTVLNLFDEAIAEYEKEEESAASAAAAAAEAPSTPTSKSFTKGTTSSSPVVPESSQPNPFQASSPLKGPFVIGSPAPASPGRKRGSDSGDEGSPKPKKARSTYRSPVSPLRSPKTTVKPKKSRRSLPAQPSKLHYSESYEED